MKLSAVVLARVIYFVESVELNPRGAAYYPDIIKGLVERYGFQKFPEKFEEFDEAKGIVLAGGKLKDKTIDKVVIGSWGITLDTTSSTSDSEALLVGALEWGAENLRLHYDPEMIKRKAYVSQIIFYSSSPLLLLNPIFDVIGEEVSGEVMNTLKFPYRFQPRGISLGIDPADQRLAIQNFTIERREGVAFSENKYFSAAPTSTDTHLGLIEMLEVVVNKPKETKPDR